MAGCYNDGDFYRYFSENMNDLGLPAPASLFDSYGKALATVSQLLAASQTLGSQATLAEIAGATTIAEKLIVAGACSASFYIGAVIGSIAVASGRSLSCGSRLSDLFAFVEQNHLEFEGWRQFYRAYPRIYNKSVPSTGLVFKARALAAGSARV